MTKAVVEYLRGLDVSGVSFGYGEPSSTDGRRPRKDRGADDASIDDRDMQPFRPSTNVLASMCRLQWLKLRDVGLRDGRLPPELSRLTKLENLSLARNSLTRLSSLKGWPTTLPALRSLVCRNNELTDGDAIPSEIFECPHLQVVDFSRNNLTNVPKGVEKAKGLLVLNLSSNRITSISSDVFVQCTDLMLLDLSDNRLESLPAQLRRCNALQQLILSNNPLRHAQLRSLAALKQLEILHLAGTERRLDNIPGELDKVEKLKELDLSNNMLTRIPEPVLSLRTLRKLNLEKNEITDLSQVTDNWPKLEYLNLGYNQLGQLPAGLTRLTSLRRLYINNNQLTFTGIPSGIGKLSDLEIFDASYNELENIPESLCRCGRLRRLILTCNRLLTLPDAIHYLRESLDVFEVDGNPLLKFPPKPPELVKGAGRAYYNIDFSLETQIRQICGKPAETPDKGYHAKDTASRLRRLRRRRDDVAETDSSCVLEGMQRIARDKETLLRQREQQEEEEYQHLSAKRWQDQLSKPELDYSNIFDAETGIAPGVEVWEVDEFYPKRVDEECAQGRMFDGDCYVVLDTSMSANQTLEWTIYYWIGSQATMDKQTCAAIHAVNLRNFLGAEGRTHREEQNDESDEFLALFDGKLMVLEGSHGETGFFHVEAQAVIPKLYRLFGQEKRLQIVSMPLSPLSLDPKFCYLIDAQSELYLWLGADSRVMVRTKGRLLAEKISVRERRGEAAIHLEAQGRESDAFWAIITDQWTPAPLPTAVMKVDEDSHHQQKQRANGPSAAHPQPPNVKPPKNVPRDFIPADWKLPQPILYDVRMGKGYLELPQVDLRLGILSKTLLDPKHVYLLDSGGELFVWVGEKSARFIRSAGYKLAQELSGLMPRGCFGGAEAELTSKSKDKIAKQLREAWSTFSRPPPQVCTQGAEPQIFRAQFVDWEEALAVDFTRTSESIAKRGADLNAILEKDKPTTDLRALFAPRERALEWDEALQLMADWNNELVEQIGPDLNPVSALQQFIMLEGKWVPVEPQWFGHFFNQDSYIVIARYWDDEEPVEDSEPDGPDEAASDRTKTVVYFWQGRETSDVQWLTFNFSVRKDMETRLSINPVEGGSPLRVEFKRIHQQQEDLLFLSHFHRQLVIHTGRYQDRLSEARLARTQVYYIRANGNPISTRTIEIKPSGTQLNTHFTYLVKVPKCQLDSSESSTDAHVWAWIGADAHPDDKALTTTIAMRIFFQPETTVEYLYPGTEPINFWKCLGGQKPYDRSADFLQYARLFRLSNDQGYFCASEKCSDFCQDDLADEDAMMLDTGDLIYIWWGKKTSDVEQKLSLQAAKLYQKHMSNVQRDRPRKLKLTTKNVEPYQFKRCFHGWGPFREPKDWSG
ncbi:protein flightless-1 [Clonorchis sinensis]|uniref:Protein flightless-1 n=1 Tax=Clonorchis sinensis TaxID=79923 RepID=H2KRI9_CLOSI|nr:protein flightless-1 [Clonorchis sinensis]